MGRYRRRAGGYSGVLFHRNRVHGSGNSETEEIIVPTPEEHLASLPTDRRCDLLSRHYDVALYHPVDVDGAAAYKKEILATCPERFIKVMKKIENFSSKHSRMQEVYRETVEDVLELLPLERRCSHVTDMYKLAVLGGGASRQLAADSKRWMAGCPGSYFEVINEVDTRSKHSGV